MKKIYLFNGPPGSGKDAICSKLADMFLGAKIVKFARPLKEAARFLYCDNNQKVFESLDAAGQKDLPNEVFYGKTCRQVQIALSENYFKQLHGEEIFGEILTKTIEASGEDDDIFFVSDSGFKPEARVLVKKFGVDNIKLFRIHREGYNFSIDSRGYIDLDDLHVESHDIENIDGKLDEVIEKIVEIIQGE